MSLCPWARFDTLALEPGAFYLVDRGHVDYGRLHPIERARAWYVTRAKRRMRYCRLHSHPVDKATGLRSVWLYELAPKTRAHLRATTLPDSASAGVMVPPTGVLPLLQPQVRSLLEVLRRALDPRGPNTQFRTGPVLTLVALALLRA